MGKEGFQTVQRLKLGCSRLKSAVPARSLWHLPLELSDGEVLWLDLISGLLNSLEWQGSFTFAEDEQGNSTYTKQDLNSIIKSKNKLQRGEKGV